jgi:tetratricopeptide (TPR) repeat protein
VLDTPAARAALRRFGLSQAGDDETRMSALLQLLEVGEIEPGTQLRVWREEQWTELVLQRYDISDEYVSVYTPQVAALLEAGMEAFHEQDLQRAEALFRQAIELEPRAKQAYNNLSAIYSRQDKPQQAREMLLAVLEIEPLYVTARCNLAQVMLADDDVDGAEEMIAPLMDVTQFNPPEMAVYAYTRARILVAQDDLEAARNALEMALGVEPDYEPAQDLLERIDALEPLRDLRDSFGAWMEQYKERDRKKRIRQQTKLATLAPSLSEALAIYTKDALTGMGHFVIPWGGWSALRKAELIA